MQMSGDFLLDLNIIIALWRADSAIMSRLPSATGIFVPVIVLGELFCGAYRSSRVAENLQ